MGTKRSPCLLIRIRSTTVKTSTSPTQLNIPHHLLLSPPFRSCKEFFCHSSYLQTISLNYVSVEQLHQKISLLLYRSHPTCAENKLQQADLAATINPDTETSNREYSTAIALISWSLRSLTTQTNLWLCNSTIRETLRTHGREKLQSQRRKEGQPWEKKVNFCLKTPRTGPAPNPTREERTETSKIIKLPKPQFFYK